jgi:hypothetical protein
VEKPKLAFQFLQANGAAMSCNVLFHCVVDTFFCVLYETSGALDAPVTARSVAKFLRICPGLPKDAVGSYLGENGKDKPQYEWEAVSFHKDVLNHYVQSFELSNQVGIAALELLLALILIKS